MRDVEVLAAAFVADLAAVWSLRQEGCVLFRTGHVVPETIVCNIRSEKITGFIQSIRNFNSRQLCSERLFVWLSLAMLPK